MVAPLSASIRTLYDISIWMARWFFFLSAMQAGNVERVNFQKRFIHINGFCMRSLVLTFFSCQIVNWLKYTAFTRQSIIRQIYWVMKILRFVFQMTFDLCMKIKIHNFSALLFQWKKKWWKAHRPDNISGDLRTC